MLSTKSSIIILIIFHSMCEAVTMRSIFLTAPAWILSLSSASVIPPLSSSLSSSAYDYKFDPEAVFTSSSPIEGKSQGKRPTVKSSLKCFLEIRSQPRRSCRYCTICSCTQPSDEQGLQFSSWIRRYLYTTSAPIPFTPPTSYSTTTPIYKIVDRVDHLEAARATCIKKPKNTRKISRRRKLKRRPSKKGKSKITRTKHILD